MNPSKDGSQEAFQANWGVRAEASYLHWTRGEPVNQIQLAFRQHWTLFQELMKNGPAGRRVLEVGCGRGSLSAYFADAGYDCTLLDSSDIVIERARAAFAANGLRATFDVGDARCMPYADRSFDVVFSIGLLEHFESVDAVLSEQVRILAPNGIFFGYVVPENPNNVQKDYRWINDILKCLVPISSGDQIKAAVFRNDAGPDFYLKTISQLALRDVKSAGVYPLPMISPSCEFPFTLMPPAAEAVLTRHFQDVLKERAATTGQHPWLCESSYGQAFLIWGWKTEA
jgi:SAM-dependent methyltransferase